MTDTIRVNGGCYCGDIKITGKVSSDKIMACHCTDCQKFSGAPFRAVAVMSADDVKISGNVTEFLKIAESGNERAQGFCGKCGSHLYATDPAKTLFMIRTGCLDQHHELVPAKHIFGKSAVEWVGAIAGSSWVVEGPPSAAMLPFKKA
ncbi:GFA family protein [Alphaproteobacteria bacterium]|nr:GFA family protein [Alphaproteobacteria bacterium]